MTNVTRSPINGQIEADDIKSPNHYTWRGKECEEIIGEITQGGRRQRGVLPWGRCEVLVPISEEGYTT